MSDKEKAFDVLTKLFNVYAYEDEAGGKCLEVDPPITASYIGQSPIIDLKEEDYKVLKHALAEGEKENAQKIKELENSVDKLEQECSDLRRFLNLLHVEWHNRAGYEDDRQLTARLDQGDEGYTEALKLLEKLMVSADEIRGYGIFRYKFPEKAPRIIRKQK